MNCQTWWKLWVEYQRTLFRSSACMACHGNDTCNIWPHQWRSQPYWTGNIHKRRQKDVQPYTDYKQESRWRHDSTFFYSYANVEQTRELVNYSSPLYLVERNRPLLRKSRLVMHTRTLYLVTKPPLPTVKKESNCYAYTNNLPRNEPPPPPLLKKNQIVMHTRTLYLVTNPPPPHC